MKRGNITTIILITLLLNLVHDFVLLDKANNYCTTSIELIQESPTDSCCSQLLEMHKAFHFLAILSELSLAFTEIKHDLFVSFLYLSSLVIPQPFKPPR